MPDLALINQATDSEQFLDRARELIPGIRERAAVAEDLRSLPEASVTGLMEAGFARALVPRRFGGLQLNWDTAFEAIRLIASGDASHAWCAGLLMEMAHFCSHLHPDAQSALWELGPDAPIASSVIPIAKFTPEGDGFRITGRSPFTSGINHADWALIGGFIQGPGGPDWCLALLPASEYEVLDTWHTIGMRGTGSNTVVTDGAYAPQTHIVRMGDLREGDSVGSRWHDTHLYRLPWLSFGQLAFITPVLGSTEAAFTAFRDWTRGRVVTSGAAMADLPTVQVKMARAAADIDAAALLLRRAVDATLGPELPTLELRARSMRDFNYCARRLVEAMDAIMEMSGSAGFSESNTIQRTWRDVHFMSTHLSMNDSNPIHWARTELGLGLLPNQTSY